MQFAKRMTLLVLIPLFCLQGGIAYWLLRHQIWTVKREMKSLVMTHAPEELITELRFSEAEFNSLEWPEPWEFLLNGKMYDIVSKVQNKDGTYTLRAVMDSQENYLKAAVRKLVDSSNKTKSESNHFNFISKTIASFIFLHIEKFSCPIQFQNYFRFLTFNFHLPDSAELRVREQPPCVC